MEEDFHAYGVFLHFMLVFDLFLLFLFDFLKLFLFFLNCGIVGGIVSIISFSFSRIGKSLYEDENKFIECRPGEESGEESR